MQVQYWQKMIYQVLRHLGNDHSDKRLHQWFSTGVPRNPWVPQKALGVPPISEFDWYLLFTSKMQLGVPPNC
jgi:hypothetical protein